MKIAPVILAILLIAASAWGVYWYKGKNSPSKPDTVTSSADQEIAYVAGGCFWCVESDFEKLPSTIDAVSGYMGGDINNPSYNQVAGGGSGHRETVKITYDPSKISYHDVVLFNVKHTDPTDDGGSFGDRGYQYTSAIYYQTEEERKIAEGVIKELNDRGLYDLPLATAVEPAGTFWVAEAYHQDFYKKSTTRYKSYRKASGRDAFIESVWGDGSNDDLFMKDENDLSNYHKPDDDTLRNILTSLQYRVTQKEGTERAFENEYWDNHEEGIYVDIVSGEPLFSSTDKFDSGTGWPSFLKPLDMGFVTEHDDYKLIIRRTEIRSTYADSHLGHILLDGPESNDKIRYCMNSAAMRFVPKDDLKAEGLEEYENLFE